MGAVILTCIGHGGYFIFSLQILRGRYTSECTMSNSQRLTTISIIEGLAQQWQQGELCDIKLQVDGQSISAHKNVLAAASKYFRSMFIGSFKESKLNEVTLKGITYTALETIITAIYTKKLKLNNKIVG